MTLAAVAAAIVVGLLVNEMSDVSPWAARKLVAWSARFRYAGTPRAEIRAEELAALINERPGKLLKLGTATGFVAASIANRIRRRMTGEPDPEPALTLDGLTRILPREDSPSHLLARYLYPNERFRGEWRRHVFQPVAEACFGIAAGVVLWATGEARLNLPGFGRAGGDHVLAANPVPIAIVVAVWCLWRVAAWRFNRFSLTNKRLMVIKGVLVRRVAMAPLTDAADLTYRQFPLGRILNYGTFILRSVSLLHPLRRIRYLPNPNELYLRAMEEIFDPAATEARLRAHGDYWGEQEEQAYAESALVLVAAMTTEIWPLVRDTADEVMRTRHVRVRAQLDTDADRMAATEASERDDLRCALTEKWRTRLGHLCDAYLASDLQESVRRLQACLPADVRAWVATYHPARDAPLESLDDALAAAPPLPTQTSDTAGSAAALGAGQDPEAEVNRQHAHRR